MHRLSAASRISIGLAFLTVSALLGAQVVRLMPDREDAVLQGRRQLCEAVAIQMSLAVAEDDRQALRTAAHAIVRRNPEVLSTAVRETDGNLMVLTPGHPQQWSDPGDDRQSRMHVPIFKGQDRWGQVEFVFKPTHPAPGPLAVLAKPMTRLVLFVAGLGFISYLFYLRRTLQHLDPSQVIPERVRLMLDSLAECVIVTDKAGRIVLANRAMGLRLGADAAQLQGRNADALGWRNPGGELQWPWREAMARGETLRGVELLLETPESGELTFMVNAAPIRSGGSVRGALATFDDVTEIETANTQLRHAMTALEQSRDEVDRQNHQLQKLASYDPLTECMNRRAFFAQLDRHWAAAEQFGVSLAVVMVDIDHFKNINDTHGHAVGDRVLKQVAEILRNAVRPGDLVCRYGGEEFCLLLPLAGAEQARAMAEYVRESVEDTPCDDVWVTISSGVAIAEAVDADYHEVINNADAALYAAKESGRNRVVLAGEEHQLDLSTDHETPENAAPAAQTGLDRSKMIRSLMTALATRDLETARHSKRVAEYCCLVGQKLLPASQARMLETAGLLHDVGKMGVPDTILLKPGPLDQDEWRVMEAHEQIGMELVSMSLNDPALDRIIRAHYCWYDGSRGVEGLAGAAIPVESRLLTLADAFDAMTSDRSYHKAMPRHDAYAELRRCAGTQFDPMLVELFIETVEARWSAEPARPLPIDAALLVEPQLQQLAQALDSRDSESIVRLARMLGQLPGDGGAEDIRRMAAALTDLDDVQSQWDQLRTSAIELLLICRSAHLAELEEAIQHPAAAPNPAT